jgi:IS30 family transposase
MRHKQNRSSHFFTPEIDSSITRKTEIADKLGFHRSTIGREIRRNKGGRGYRPKQAHRLASEREASKHGPYKMNPVIMTQITERLEMKWSPEQISNRLRLEGEESVSAETIYKFIDEDRSQGGELWRHLRRSSRTRKRRFPCEDRRGKIQNARPISERPKGANSRRSVGHWERDLMVGKNHKSAVLVVTDRKYSSYQRGTNENRIGAIRQYLPKKTDLTNLTNKDLEKIEFQINNRPMKCLDWMTPVEFMMEKSCTGKL